MTIDKRLSACLLCLLILAMPRPAHAMADDPPANPDATAAARAVLAYLQAVGADDCRVISGQQAGHGADAAAGYAALIEQLHAATGEWTGLAAVDYYDWSGARNYAAFNQPLIAHWEAGGLVSVSWHAPNPWTGGDAWDLRNADLRALTDPADPMHDVWLAMLDEAAGGLAELRDAGVVVLWRPLHEMNGDWFWWGTAAHPGAAEPYRLLWRQMFDYFTDVKGLDNLLWVYSTADASFGKPAIDFFYPGAAYVDIVGQDIYDDRVAGVNYADFLALDKPFALTEVGPLTQRDGSFDNLTLLSALRDRYPRAVYWLTWSDWSEGGALQHLSMVRNRNAAALLADRCVVNRDDIALDAPPAPDRGHSVFELLEAEDHDAMAGVETYPDSIGFVDEGDWLRYDQVDFNPLSEAMGATHFYARVAVPAEFAGRQIELRLNDPTSAPVGAMTIAATGGWDTPATQRVEIAPISGVHDLYLTFSGGSGAGNFDWFRFAPVSAPAPVASIPAALFGMHSHRAATTGEWPSAPFAGWRLHDADGLFWHELEAEQDVWDFTRFDRAVALAEANGAELLYVLGQTPVWAAARPDAPSAYNIPGASSEPADMADWRDYVRTVATRYRGQIAYYELWNEPDLTEFYSGDVATMVMLGREAAAIIREVDPAARIVAPSIVPNLGGADWLDAYLAAGGGAQADIIGAHFYLSGAAPPERIPPLANEVRRVMAKHGLAEKPLWNTESNFGYAGEGIFITGDDALGYVARSYLVQWRAGIERHYWYAWENQNFVGLRFTEADEVTPTPAAEAYAVTQSWLIGATMGECAIDLDLTWICNLTAADGQPGQIVWNPEGAAPYMPPAEATALRRLTGTVEDVAGGREITVDVMPIYLELACRWPSAACPTARQLFLPIHQGR